MLKKDVVYTDFNGDKRTETLYFNLTEPEVVRLDVEIPGGLEYFVARLDAKNRPDEILELFEKVIKRAYGEKSEDGRHFIKDPEKTNLFYQSAAYGALFMHLIQDAEQASEFFNRILTSTVPNVAIPKARRNASGKN